MTWFSSSWVECRRHGDQYHGNVCPFCRCEGGEIALVSFFDKPSNLKYSVPNLDLKVYANVAFRSHLLSSEHSDELVSMGVYERLQQDNTRDFSWLIQQVLLPRPPDSTTTLPASDVQQSIVPASLHNQQYPYNLDAFVDQYGPTASPNPLIAPPQPYFNTPHQSQDIFAIPANSSPYIQRANPTTVLASCLNNGTVTR